MSDAQVTYTAHVSCPCGASECELSLEVDRAGLITAVETLPLGWTSVGGCTDRDPLGDARCPRCAEREAEDARVIAGEDEAMFARGWEALCSL